MRRIVKKPQDLELIKRTVLKELDKQLSKKDVEEIKLNYNLKKASLPAPKVKPLIEFTAQAWIKTLTLLAAYSDEFALHGVVSRNEEDKIYTITNVLVYPQTVTTATAEASDDYGPWLHDLPDDVFNNLRMQMHSHVNMTTSPSGVDTNLYHSILQQVKDYYIFIIMNKKLNLWANIYDIKENVIYEEKDIDFSVLSSEGMTMQEWLAEAKENIEVSKYAYGAVKSHYPPQNFDEYDDWKGVYNGYKKTY